MPLTDEQVVANHDDVEMLKRKHLWPGSSINLKGKGKHADRFAVCVPDGPGLLVVRYKGLSYDLEPSREGLTYPDAEAVVDDGWKVD